MNDRAGRSSFRIVHYAAVELASMVEVSFCRGGSARGEWPVRAAKDT